MGWKKQYWTEQEILIDKVAASWMHQFKYLLETAEYRDLQVKLEASTSVLSFFPENLRVDLMCYLSLCSGSETVTVGLLNRYQADCSSK